MRIALLCVLLALSACGPDEVVPEGSFDASPDSEPPVSDGEYIIEMTPTYFVCVSSGPLPLESTYSVANVVDQNAWTSDISSELQGTLLEYDRKNLKRAEDGSFFDESEDQVYFGGSPLTRRRRLEGFIDGRSLVFSHHFDIGWKDPQDLYHSECVYDADVKGTALYERWNGLAASGISGQWRVTRTIEESPLNYGQALPYARADIVTIISQSRDDSLVQLLGLYRIPTHWITRNASTGRIDAVETSVSTYLGADGSQRTLLQDTVTTGTVLPERIDIEQSFHVWTAPTDTLPAEEHGIQRERYAGVPRYRADDRLVEERPDGTYLATYEMTWNDCGFAPYSLNKLLRVLPIGNEAVWPQITGSDREPFVTPNTDGTFSAPFTRHTHFWRYDYEISGRLEGHDAKISIIATRRDLQSGTYDCSATYSVTGPKLYMTARP